MVTEFRKQQIAKSAGARMRKHRQISRVIQAENQAIEKMAREYAESALDTIITIMSDDQKPARDRIKAATEILDRGYGKCVERSFIASMTETLTDDYSRMDTRTLIELAMQKLKPVSSAVETSHSHVCDLSAPQIPRD